MGESDEHDEQKMRVSHQQMSDSRVPLHVRDYCAHVLIPLNKYVWDAQADSLARMRKQTYIHTYTHTHALTPAGLAPCN